MSRGLLVLSLFFLFCSGQDWPCQFQFDDNYYDLTPANSNPDSPDGLWHTTDPTINDYYFKLCEETTSIPDAEKKCSAGTQVCQRDYFKNSHGCGVNPVTSAFESGSGKGVVMYATGGSSDGCPRARQSYLEVLCPTGTGFSSGTFGPVTEQVCSYAIPFYHDVGCPTNSPTSQTDALSAIYQSTDGANWKDNTNWLSSLDQTGCSWYGVECDSNNAVTQLRLFDNGLEGTLPSELSGLTMVENILLQNNSLSGAIPDLSAFKSLKNLYLSGNKFSGSFPDITTLSSLVEIDIHSNKMTGGVPSNLCDIDYFNIKDNDWICPFPPCCLSAAAEKTRCGSCQWTNI